MKGVVIAGGHGTRLKPWTYASNKNVVPVANQPMICFAIRRLKEAGIRRIGVVLGPVSDESGLERHSDVTHALGSGSKLGVSIEYLYHPQPKGLASAVKAAKGFVAGEPFVALLADSLVDEALGPSIRRFDEGGLDSLLSVTPVRDPSRYGIAEVRGDEVVRLVEKPKRWRSNLAVKGTYVLGPRIFKAIEGTAPSKRGELEITDALQNLLQSGGKVGFRRIKGWSGDMGTPSGLLRANKHVLLHIPLQVKGSLSKLTRVEGKVGMGAGSSTIGNVRLIGPVIIGERCVIGPGCTLGPNVAVGDDTVIRRASIRDTIVMRRCEIDCDTSISSSVIGNDTALRLQFAHGVRHRLYLGDGVSMLEN